MASNKSHDYSRSNYVALAFVAYDMLWLCKFDFMFSKLHVHVYCILCSKTAIRAFQTNALVSRKAYDLYLT